MSKTTLFDELYKDVDCQNGSLVLCDTPASGIEKFCDFTSEDMEAILEPGNRKFFRVPLMRNVDKGKQGGKANVSVVTCLHLDVDCGKPGYCNRKAVLSLLKGLDKPPSRIVNSDDQDGGFHCYWILDEPVILSENVDEQKRQYVEMQSRQDGIQRYVRSQLEKLECSSNSKGDKIYLDSGQAVCRLLRIPGTKRDTGNLVTTEHRSGRRYKLEDFEPATDKRDAPCQHVLSCQDSAPTTCSPSGSTCGGSTAAVDRWNKSPEAAANIVAIMAAQGHVVRPKDDYWEYKHSASQSENPITGTIGKLKSNSGNLLVVSFSPNCVFGNQPRGISLQQALADLEHGGDLKAATSEIHDLEPVDEFAANLDTSVFINSSEQGNERLEPSLNSSGDKSNGETFDIPHTWKKLEPLRQAADLPEFPVDALPTSLSDWVSQESEATQTPPDMAALLAIAVCAVPLAKRVEVLAREPWVEPTNLYVATILEPANRKSAVFKDAQKPLRQVEKELIKKEAPEKAKEDSRQRAKRLRLKKLEKTAAEDPSAKKRDEAQREADELSVEVAAFLPIEETTLIVDNVTSEKLAVMMQANGERIASMSAEGGVFELMKGRYAGGQTDIDIYLQGHSGDSVSVNRVIRGPVKLDAPALTMALAIQPEVIRGIAGNSAFRGRGLLGRFLYAVPRSWVGERKIAPEPVDRLVRLQYENAVKDLAEIELNSEGQPHRIKLSSEAAKTFKPFAKYIESELKVGSGGTLEDMPDWGGKLAGATLRIAGILHCVERGTQGVAEDIGVETIENAQRIAEWAIPHAAAAFDLLTDGEDDPINNTNYLLQRLRTECEPGETFTRRDCTRLGRRFTAEPERLDAALARLVETNHIRKLPATGKRKPYAISPRCWP